METISNNLIRKSENEDYRQLVELIDDVVYKIDAQGYFMYVSPASKRLLGYVPEELVGKSFLNILDPEFKKELIFFYSSQLESKSAGTYKEFRVIRKDGTGIWVGQSVSLLFLPNQEVKEIIGVARDITKLKKVEEENFRLAQITRGTHDAIFTTDIEGAISYWNKAAENIFGYCAEEIIEKHLEVMIPPKNSVFAKDLHEKIVAGQTIKDFETIMLKKSGDPIVVSLMIFPLENEHKKIVKISFVARDVTNIKNREIDILNALIEGQETERKRISYELHDGLGQTLGAINLYLNAAKKNLEKENYEQTIDLFTTASDLVRNAMAETRMISHNLTPNSLKQFGLVQAIDELIHDLTNLGNNCHLQIELIAKNKNIRYPDNIEMAIYRVIQEAINNAVKHSEANKLVIKILASKEKIIVNCSDDGKGFDVKTQTVNQSNAIGIKSMRNRIKSIGGTIRIFSKPQKGTKINISARQ